jgi:branched-chain amino acid transport system substrate-binding protein
MQKTRAIKTAFARRRLIAISATACTLVLAASGLTSGAAAAGGIPAGPIKFGIIAALSGPNAAVGELVKGEDTAFVNHINSEGGIDGHKIDLLVENSEGNPAIAVSEARQFVADHVVATLYNGATAEGKNAVVAIEEAAHIIGVAEESLSQYESGPKNPYYFNVNPLDSQTTAGIASFAKSHNLGPIGEIGDGSPFAASLEDNFNIAAKADGLKIVKTISYPETATSMTTELSVLKQAGAKSLAVWCEVGCAQTIDSLHTLGWSPPILSGDILGLLAFTSLKNLGPTTYESCPIYDTAGVAPTATETEDVKLLVSALGAESPEDWAGVETGDDLGVLVWGIKKADSTNGTAIKDALETMKDQKFDNPNAEYTFTAQDHSGFTPTTPNHQIPMCVMNKLGALDFPIKASAA